MQDVEERLKTLMIQSLAGDGRAYRSLLDDVAQRLRAYYGRRLNERSVVDDLVQDTLIAIHTRRVTYDQQRPFMPWLYAIARYKLIDHFRLNKRQDMVALDEAPEALLAAEPTHELAHRDIESVLECVPPLQRELIKAVKIEGRSVAEVAVSSGLSQSAIKVTIHRALKALNRRFGGGRNDE